MNEHCFNNFLIYVRKYVYLFNPIKKVLVSPHIEQPLIDNL